MDSKEFPRRRKRLMNMMGDDSVAILPTAAMRTRSRDTYHAYRPDSDFYYLSRFPEPEAVAVLIPDRRHGEFVLFCRERDAKAEIWDGRRAGLEGAREAYGADDAFPIADLDEILPGLLEDKERIYYTMGNDQHFDQRVIGWVNQLRQRSRAGIHAPEEFISLSPILHDLRMYKSRAEIKAMRQAAKIAAGAHVRAMQRCRPGLMEYQIEAEFLHEFMRNGARSPAYTSIVGGGANGCILHYINNDAELKDGELLLIDAGAEYEGYASDITRTFPINGQFTGPQAEIYELVLAAQQAAIDKVKPGNHWNDPQDAAIKVITRGLVALKLLRGRVPTLIKEKAYRKYYMHRIGHWLGMDVHDVGDYKLDGEWRLLEPGMALTIEPGLYLPAARGLAKKWWNIGVRIEDDVLVTRSGNDVLSKGAPKTIAEIEALMANGAA